MRLLRIVSRGMRSRAVSAIACLPLAVVATSVPASTVARQGLPPAQSVAPDGIASVVGGRGAHEWTESRAGDGGLPGEDGRPSKVTVSSPKGKRTVLESSTGIHDIPTTALRAYQRAAGVLAGVKPTCQIPWTLLAAIGRVESYHGQYAGAVLGIDGFSTPAIVGVPLNGIGPVAAIPDSDNGSVDRDKVWDRAVGPMQFIPTTWSAVAVDGDGDGLRSPHDIDDATLAAAVYLCSGSSSLLDPDAMRLAILRYNHSSEYATLVMAYERAYRDGDFVTSSTPAFSVTPADAADTPTRTDRTDRRTKGATPEHETPRTHVKDTVKGTPVASDPKPAPTEPPAPAPAEDGPATPAPPPTDPTSPPSEDPTSPPSEDPTSPPSEEPTTDSEPTPSPEPDPDADSPVRVTGLLGTCDDGFCLAICNDGFCLDGTPLDLGSEEMLTQTALADFDGKDGVQDNQTELEGLVDTTVTMLVVKQPDVWVVHGIDDMDYLQSAD